VKGHEFSVLFSPENAGNPAGLGNGAVTDGSSEASVASAMGTAASPITIDQRRLNSYIRTYLGEEFTAKDFRTWGGTLTAAVELAQRPAPESEAEAKRQVLAGGALGFYGMN